MSKSYIICDDVGTPIYFGAENISDPRLICMQFAATQDLMAENFNQVFKSLRTANGTHCIFQKYENLLFIIVSSEREQSEPYLRRQLQLVYEMMLFKFGSQVSKHLTDTRQRVRRRALDSLSRFVDTVCYLCDNEQSFLVQSIERLEVNDDLRGKCVKALDDACAAARGAHHALLFVGTKLVAHFARPRSFDLHPSDIFLITVYFHSHFYPKDKLDDDDDTPVESGSESAPPSPMQSKGKASASGQEDFVRARGGGNVSVGRGEEVSLDSACFDTVFLHTPELTKCWLYTAQVAESTTLVVINEASEGAKQKQEAEERMRVMRKYVRDSLVDFIDFLVIRASTHVTMLSYLYSFPGIVHFIFVDRTNQQVVAPTVIPLHGQMSVEDEQSAAKSSVDYIKRKVWDMCSQVQQRVAEGFTSMLVRKDGFLYSYRLWIESEDKELPFELPAVAQNVSLDSSYLNDLIKRMYPNHRLVNCYEIYTIYAGTLPLETVAHYNKKLLSQLRETRSMRMFQTLQTYNVNW